MSLKYDQFFGRLIAVIKKEENQNLITLIYPDDD